MPENHLIPNSTQVPNLVLDLLIPLLHDGEARVLLYLCRRTYGFQRQADRISLDQFTHGIRGNPRQHDFGMGLGRQGVINGLAVLLEAGIVEQIEGGQGRGRIPVYRLNLKCEMVYWLDLIAQEPDSAREKIVQRLDLFRKKRLHRRPFDAKGENDATSAEKSSD
jgi:hypothetical protein